MSSSPQTERLSIGQAGDTAAGAVPGPSRRRPRVRIGRSRLWRRLTGRWSLRARLIAALAGLLALVCVVIGVASTLALRDFLISRLDAELALASSRTSRAYEHPPRSAVEDPEDSGYSDEPGPGFLDAPGQAAGTLGARLVGGAVVEAAVLDDAGVQQPLPDRAVSALTGVKTDGQPQTVDLGALDAYRVTATAAPGGVVLVTGLPMSGVTSTVWRMAAVATGVAVAGVLAVGGLGAVIVRRSLHPLRRVAATATQVTKLPLDRGEVALGVRVPSRETDSRTEVGQVGAALNRLLEHVAAALNARHASETRVRQFVADASHELRTPLAAIRGYAELTRPSRRRLPPDVAYALRRVESESIRMTGLVEDLLLLARLDAGRPLLTEPVDLTQLVVDTVGDAHVAGPDHSWQLALPDEPIVVAGDIGRLHQVLANLLANARTHTPPGTTVRVSLAAIGGEAVVTVADDGPGIPPELIPEVFERFARGDSSRSRAAGSTGLGLSIVAAVVEAHRGTVAIDSRPGQTVLRVTVPLSDPAAQAGDHSDHAVRSPAGHSDGSEAERTTSVSTAIEAAGDDGDHASGGPHRGHGSRSSRPLAGFDASSGAPTP